MEVKTVKTLIGVVLTTIMLSAQAYADDFLSPALFHGLPMFGSDVDLCPSCTETLESIDVDGGEEPLTQEVPYPFLYTWHYNNFDLCPSCTATMNLVDEVLPEMRNVWWMYDDGPREFDCPACKNYTGIKFSPSLGCQALSQAPLKFLAEIEEVASPVERFTGERPSMFDNISLKVFNDYYTPGLLLANYGRFVCGSEDNPTTPLHVIITKPNEDLNLGTEFLKKMLFSATGEVRNFIEIVSEHGGQKAVRMVLSETDYLGRDVEEYAREKMEHWESAIESARHYDTKDADEVTHLDMVCSETPGVCRENLAYYRGILLYITRVKALNEKVLELERQHAIQQWVEKNGSK